MWPAWEARGSDRRRRRRRRGPTRRREPGEARRRSRRRSVVVEGSSRSEGSSSSSRSSGWRTCWTACGRGEARGLVARGGEEVCATMAARAGRPPPRGAPRRTRGRAIREAPLAVVRAPNGKSTRPPEWSSIVRPERVERGRDTRGRQRTVGAEGHSCAVGRVGTARDRGATRRAGFRGEERRGIAGARAARARQRTRERLAHAPRRGRRRRQAGEGAPDTGAARR